MSKRGSSRENDSKRGGQKGCGKREGRADAENTSRQTEEEKEWEGGREGERKGEGPRRFPAANQGSVMLLLISIVGGVAVGKRQRGRESAALHKGTPQVGNLHW